MNEEKYTKDVTSLVQELDETRAALAKKQSEFDTLLDCIDELLISIESGTTRILHISETCERVMGYTQEYMKGAAAGLRTFIHPDDLRILDIDCADLEPGSPLRKQCRFIHRDGSVRWIELKCRSVQDNPDQTTRLDGIIKDITKAKKSNKALMESEYLFRQFFDRAHEAMLVLDVATGLLCDYNQTALELFKYTGTEMLTHTPVSLSVEYQPDGTPSAIGARRYTEQAMMDERPVYDWVFQDADGHPIPCEVRLNLVSIDGQKLIRSSIIDITERKKAEAEVHALNDSLERKVKERTAELVTANNQLETFSYTVSHDLQAPLRAISGFSRLLLEEHDHQLDSEGREMLRVIDQNSIRMSHLIKDLLSFAKLDRAECKKEETDMNSIVKYVIEEIKAEQPDIRADISVGNLGVTTCDPKLIRQVWVNLISNAIKYSAKKEKPQIEIGADTADGIVTYYIKDNGAGFDMKYAKKLFSAFSRMHSEAEFEGTGIGLAMAANVISRHGGRIWANAAPNMGATFYFTLC